MHLAPVKSHALGSVLLRSKGETLIANFLLVAGGALLLSLLAQISIPLPFTPVPITGQTFGVAFLSLLLGRNRAISVLLLYISAGAAGAPVFSAGKAGLLWGPTLGYLLAMAPASAWVGFLADRGWAKSFFSAWLAAASGSVIIFSGGLAGLSFFLPSGGLLAAGLWPFLPGDLLKNCLAALGASLCDKYFSR